VDRRKGDLHLSKPNFPRCIFNNAMNDGCEKKVEFVIKYEVAGRKINEPLCRLHAQSKVVFLRDILYIKVEILEFKKDDKVRVIYT